VGWLIAIVLFFFAYARRKEIKTLRARIVEAELERDTRETVDAAEQRALRANSDLIVLRLHLEALRAAGTLPADGSSDPTKQIDGYWAADFNGVLPARDSKAWRDACQRAWNVLRARGLASFGASLPDGAPPTEARAAPASMSGERVAQPRPAAATAAPRAPVRQAPAAPGARAPAAGMRPPQPVQRDHPTQSAESSGRPVQPERPAQPAQPAQRVQPAQPVQREQPLRPAQRARDAREASAHAWRPVETGPLENALRAMSGWPQALVPFLVQNVGWFIGGFLFLAGTVFLVAYTTGFAKAAIVCGSLYAYTVFLIWAGYKLLRRQPPVTAAGSVLLSTGLLLVPLALASVAVLLRNTGGSSLLLAVGLGAAAVCLATFYYAAQLVSGIVHRSLQGDYARLFLAIAGLQLTAPLVARWPSWPVLAALHVFLLGLVAYGLVRFARGWLQTVFVDHKKVTLFAGGALLYAAVVTFVHWTWAAPSVALPQGYYAPYLMAVCGLLFYVDAELKLHAHKAAFLSRFSFLIYGLTVVAALMSFDAPAARLVTLALAAGLYAIVLWKYLTLVPLYLMLASVGGLYAWGVLAPFPRDTHFLLALPGIYALCRLSLWATARSAHRAAAEHVPGMARIGRATYHIALVLLPAAAVLSLVNGKPGVVGMSSALVLAAALWWWLRAAPGALFTTGGAEGGAAHGRQSSLLDGPWLYAVVVPVAVSVFYAPQVADAPRALQGAFGLLLLGVFWAARLVHARARGRAPAARAEVYANSALLCILAAAFTIAALAFAEQTPPAALITALAAGTVVLAALSLHLYVRWLFYACLLFAGAAAALVKSTYFPQPSVGLLEMVAGLGIATVLRWLDRSPDELSAIAQRRAWRDAPRRLLWIMPCRAADEDDGDADAARRPLLSAAALERRMTPATERAGDV
jgi:hypothetical protein